MYVTFKVGVGKWSTVGITEKGIFPSGANIAMAKQTDSLLVALAVGKNGAMYALWVEGGGVWNKPAGATRPAPYPPHPITPSGMFNPGADIAMVKQTNNRLTAWAAGKDGSLYQSAVDDPRWHLNNNDNYEWNKPILICHLGGWELGCSPSNNGIAAHKQTSNMLTVLSINNDGALERVQIDRLCNSYGCIFQALDKALDRVVDVPIKEPRQIGPKNLFPRGGDIAMAQQADNLLTALAVGNDGALYVSWAVGGGEWQGPVGITPPKLFPPGASIAMTKQTKDILSALIVGNDGALYRSWVVGGGVWNKPPPGIFGSAPFPPQAISPKELFYPGDGIATVNFNGVMEALIKGKDGSVHVSWAVGDGKWDGPVRIFCCHLEPPPPCSWAAGATNPCRFQGWPNLR
jgi:hypothetical protein